MPEPQFEGQTKTKLGNGEVKGLVDKIVYEGILDFLEENPSIGRKVIEKVFYKFYTLLSPVLDRFLIKQSFRYFVTYFANQTNNS